MTSPETQDPASQDAAESGDGRPDGGSPRRHVVVAGGGIGGLTAALALERAGFSVLVLERSEKLGEVGAGLQISPNAWRVLKSLDATEPLEKVLVKPDSIRIHSARAGGQIGRIPLGETAEHRYGAPYCVIHRGDLHKGLAETAMARPNIDIQLGIAIADAEEDETGITVEIQGSEGISSHHAEALIAADGVWSTVRRRLLRLPSADYSGRIAYRATFSTDQAPDLAGFTGLWMGENAHLVHYPIRSGSLINLVAIAEGDWHGETWSTPVDRDEVLQHFKNWPVTARHLLERPASSLKWALCDIRPGTIWAEGRIALLGDAAHAMLPFMAQGAAMAIEDAHVVARCLAEEPDVDEALLTYERTRKDRVERVMRTARENARIYHMKGLMAFLRDTGIRYLSGQRLLSRYDWIYDWQPK
ncbi:FAD-dependent monooxygenase [Breoghania sp.]|uniref:FAD-dependent monooxygenase n=1 Tax=Breoghania sp. TaxID=2065378 RepID=UPI00261AFE53|nr:FAD-dependent monooxygenase [Breoghania sp.]MDJ0931982.1 FAD-dependent monooxygenase [Breoghania sp.]